MAKNGKETPLMWLFLGLLFLVVCAIIIKYVVDGFTASQCTFTKLGDYNLSTDVTIKGGVTSYGTKQGLIYIPTGSTTFDSLQYQKANDSNYSYISLTKTDLNGTDVFSKIKSIMECKGVPEFSGDIGINSKPAIILCLQNNSGTLSRTFFIKCFVPSANSTVNDSNVIVGEIANNSSSAVYSTTVRPVAFIQNSIGIPNILSSTLTNYSPTVTYTIGDIIFFNGKTYRMRESAGTPGYAPDRINDTLWTLITDYTYSLSYTICPAASRPEGFAYTDCCSTVDATARLTTSTWADLVLTNTTTCPASATTSGSSTTTPTSTNKSTGCGSNPDDSSCPIPYCSLKSTNGACSGSEMVKDSTTGKYLDPTCKVGNYSDFGGRLNTICTGTGSSTRNNTNSNDLDIYNLLKNRSQYHNWVEDDDSDSGTSGDNGDSGESENSTKNNWFTGSKWQNKWTGDTSILPKNNYSSNKDNLLSKDKSLEGRLARLESQMTLNNSSEDVCDDACSS